MTLTGIAAGLRSRPLRAVALAALLSLPGLAGAQSLKELYEAARSYDATYLAARAQADSAQYLRDRLHAVNRPSVNLSAGADRSETLSGDRSGTNTASAQVSAQQTLFNRADRYGVSQADRAYLVSQAQLQVEEHELILRVAQAYFDVLAAQDTLGTAQANKKAISEQLASAKRNFEVGTATITDTREAQARFDLATAQELVAENDLRTKRVALDQLVGRDGVSPKPLKSPVVLPQVNPSSVEEWVKLTDQTPLVRQAQLAFDVAKLETAKAGVGGWPVVTLDGNVGTSNTSGDGARQLGRDGTTNQASIGVSLRMPLYAGGAIQARKKETVLLEEQARNDLEASRRAVSQSTRQIFLAVQSGQAQVKAFEAAESSSKLALEATQLGYRVGVRVNLDVLNAQTQLFTTQRDLARARYDVILNDLRLRQSAGTLNPGDLDAANALLAP